MLVKPWARLADWLTAQSTGVVCLCSLVARPCPMRLRVPVIGGYPAYQSITQVGNTGNKLALDLTKVSGCQPHHGNHGLPLYLLAFSRFSGNPLECKMWTPDWGVWVLLTPTFNYQGFAWYCTYLASSPGNQGITYNKKTMYVQYLADTRTTGEIF